MRAGHYERSRLEGTVNSLGAVKLYASQDQCLGLLKQSDTHTITKLIDKAQLNKIFSPREPRNWHLKGTKAKDKLIQPHSPPCPLTSPTSLPLLHPSAFPTSFPVPALLPTHTHPTPTNPTEATHRSGPNDYLLIKVNGVFCGCFLLSGRANTMSLGFLCLEGYEPSYPQLKPQDSLQCSRVCQKTKLSFLS